MKKKIIEIQRENILGSVNSLREWHETNGLPEDDQFEYTLSDMECTVKILRETVATGTDFLQKLQIDSK